MNSVSTDSQSPDISDRRSISDRSRASSARIRVAIPPAPSRVSIRHSNFNSHEKIAIKRESSRSSRRSSESSSPVGSSKGTVLAKDIPVIVEPPNSRVATIPENLPMLKDDDNPITQINPSKENTTILDDKIKRNSFSIKNLFTCCLNFENDKKAKLASNIEIKKNKTIIRSLPLPSNETDDMTITRNSGFLKPILPQDAGKKCLVLDLDETLVHSSFKPVPNPDFVIPVMIDSTIHSVYVLKRPNVDHFLKRVGEWYEIVVFTASLAKYADPVIDLLDKQKVVRHRLFREACHNHKGIFVKDMGKLGRELKNIIIVDNSPASYMFHPKNALPVTSWFSDPNDTELLQLLKVLEGLKDVDDVMGFLDTSN
ncbi:NIF-domain-containing protein [Rozella allomycis CSF55]|uniref:protein-serine/threonine phosphatase n=1 Tax=Rozella allomycis (strain CSF55) TaxID=988480 RepID=A0A075AP18_ROZAC|nr:HAD-like domain-containing protein [Rozella allomycis CSF55]RKP22160.1 NIF-domain-containing protein [Rozella allomycis CSF55]|eukprot:EPZ31737.1 HAD-like domain-containing protein [Rozella allomycis CSF55]